MLSAQLLRRAMEVFGKLPDRTEIAADRGRRVVAPLKLVQHALAKWGHGNLLPMTTHPSPAGLPSLHHHSQSAAPAASFKPAIRTERERVSVCPSLPLKRSPLPEITLDLA